MITQRVIDLDTLINSSIPQSKTPEYLIDTQVTDEEVNGVRVRVFPIPRARLFSVHEVVYLAAALTTELDIIKKRIDELKLGRKVIQKLYAVRLDAEPWPLKPLRCRYSVIGRKTRGASMRSRLSQRSLGGTWFTQSTY